MFESNSEKVVKTIIANGTPTVLFFAGSTCPPCIKISPMIHKLSKSYPRVTFVKIYVDKPSDMSIINRIEATPTFYYYKNGIFRSMAVGADVNKVISMIKN